MTQRKKQINNFINNYISKEELKILPSNKVHKLFCTIYNLNEKEVDIRAFIPYFKKLLVERGWSVTSRKIRLKDLGGKPRNCIIGISLNVDLLPKKEQSKEHSVPSSVNKVESNKDTNIKKTKMKVQKKERLKDIDLRPFIKKYYEVGSFEDRLGTDEIHNLCLEYFKENTEILEKIQSKSHFTPQLKYNWSLIYPDHTLETGDHVRDPNDRKKRGVAYIKKKGS